MFNVVFDKVKKAFSDVAENNMVDKEHPFVSSLVALGAVVFAVVMPWYISMLLVAYLAYRVYINYTKL
jgi:divalent metal cation (Fe/Co/Zn/Cd) transporter